MKILIIGVLDTERSSNIFMKKAFQQIGHAVDEYNYRTRAAELGSPQAMWTDFCGFLQDKQYDLILFSKVNSMHPKLISYAKEHGKTFYWFMDDISVAKAIQMQIYAQEADIVSVTSKEVKDWLSGEFSIPAHQIIEGFDTETHYVEDCEKKYDLLFAGSPLPKRVRYCSELKDEFNLIIAGEGWPDEFESIGNVYARKLRGLIAQSRIILNFTHQNAFSDRIVISMACGGFVLTEYANDLVDFFSAKEHLVWFHDINEAKELIRYYLGNEDKRRQIAFDGSQYVQRFSWKKQCQEIIDIGGH